MYIYKYNKYIYNRCIYNKVGIDRQIEKERNEK